MGYPSGGGSKGGPGSAPGGEYGTTANHNKSDTMVKTALNTDVDVRSAMDQLLGGDGKVFRGDNHQSDDRQAKKNNRDAVMAAALFTEAGRDSSNPQGDVIKNQLADMFAKSDGNTTVAHWQGQVMDNIRRV